MWHYISTVVTGFISLIKSSRVVIASSMLTASAETETDHIKADWKLEHLKNMYESVPCKFPKSLMSN
ncbi:hypothetical protein VNO77_11664 [Canavalia gladiata]|uniref:Uncharacterized protein n=1 Tax=Canavalia gladiata TaxID=3824 RepID=A0AAN9QYD4_CANGL